MSYRSNASQIAELTGLRERLTKAIEASTKAQDANTPAGRQLTEDLRGRLSGVNERIASIGKKNRNTEPDQIARAELEGRVRAVRDALTSEREALSFQERFLQGAFQAGESTMVEYFDRKREAIERGVQAEVAALDQEIAALQAYQAKIAKKDPSAAVQAGERIEDARREQERLRNRASNEVALANQQQEASFRQLNDQVTAYRANLLQLQGDEEGAARLRAQQAIEQAQILARQAGAGVDVQGLRQASDQNITLSTTRRQTTEVQTRLQMREERIAQDQRAGSITTLDSLAAVSEGRRKAVAELEELVRAQEEVARSRPKDYQLQIDTERARHELELLKGELDPLQEQFRNLFTDAGTDFFTSLMEGKGLKGALKAFGDMVGREINGVVGRELSEQLFGKNGALGGAGGFLADIFGKGGEAGKSAATASSAAAITAETTARTTATAAITAASTSSAAALSAMTAAASAAAAALSAVAASSGAGAASGFASALGSGPGFLNDLGGLEVFGSLGFSDGGFTGHMDTKKAAGVVHGQEYVFSAPAVKAIGVDRLERMHRKAKTGQDVEEELPGYSAGGYVAVLGTSPQTLRRGNQYLMALQAPPPVKSGDTYVTHHTNHVNVTATPGTTRQTALQTGREVGRGIEMARARNGR